MLRCCFWAAAISTSLMALYPAQRATVSHILQVRTIPAIATGTEVIRITMVGGGMPPHGGLTMGHITMAATAIIGPTCAPRSRDTTAMIIIAA